MCREWHSLSELHHFKEEIEHFSVFAFLSRPKRNKTSEHSFNTSFSVCIPSLNPPAQKSQNQRKGCLTKRKKKWQQGTAAKYTQEGSILVIFTITLWQIKEMRESFTMGKDDLQMSYVFVTIFIKI